MRSNFIDQVTQSFVFSKLLPGILIGLFAYNVSAKQGDDLTTFIFSMVIFWAAIGVGHGLAQLATQRTS